MWNNALKHAAWLVKCPDDTPVDVVKMRCNAANTIKRQWDKIERLEGENTDLNLKLALWMGAVDRDKRDLVAEVASLQDRLRAAHGGCRMLSEGSKCDCGLCKRDREIHRLQAELVDAAEGAVAAGAIIKARDAKIERLKWIQDWLARQLSNRTGRSMSNHIIEANEAYGRLAKLPGKDGD